MDKIKKQRRCMPNKNHTTYTKQYLKGIMQTQNLNLNFPTLYLFPKQKGLAHPVAPFISTLCQVIEYGH